MTWRDDATTKHYRPGKTGLPPMLRPSEVAEMLGLHRDTLLKIPTSELPVHRVGPRGDRRYSRSDVEAYLASRRQA